MKKNKIVIRRLPSTMTSDEFLQFISPVGMYDYYYFVQGNLSGNVFSRAYINFIQINDVMIFKDRFDGYIFINDKGNEYQAIVEYAPFCKILSGKQKHDARVASIYTDADYLMFLDSLNNNFDPSVALPESILEEIESKERLLKANNGCLPVKTPLIEYVIRKRDERISNNVVVKEDKKRRDRQKEENKKKKSNQEKDLKPKVYQNRPTENRNLEEVKKCGKHGNTVENKKHKQMAKSSSTGKVSHDSEMMTAIEKNIMAVEKVKKHSYELQRRTQNKESVEENDNIPNQVKSQNEQKSSETSDFQNDAIVDEFNDFKNTDLELSNTKMESNIEVSNQTNTYIAMESKESIINIDGGDSDNRRKPKIRYRDRPEKAIYKPGQKSK